MSPDQWLSLGLDLGDHALFQSGGFRTIEAAGQSVVGLPQDGSAHRTLGTASSREEAVVIATILRLFNPG